MESRFEAARHGAVPLCLLACASLLAGCAIQRPPTPPAISADQTRQWIDRSLPSNLVDRDGWADDIYAAFTSLAITPSHENICAVTAVIAQESGFRVDPVIPGLPAIAWREIDRRAEHADIPRMVVHGVLELKSPNGRSYSDRIDSARTEKDLSDIYEDFIGTVPLGRTLFADRNPIRTRGPMQVNVAFVKQYSMIRPYPYPIGISIEDEAFTRRGSLYFGMAHLLDYSAPYDRFVYRFADYNAGQFASRNAAFQSAIAKAGGPPVTPDGALLPTDTTIKDAGSTETAAQALAGQLGLGEGTIHGMLEQGKSERFEHTPLYQRIFTRGDQRTGRRLPRAVLPRIELHGPKITRNLTTEWYAHRVDDRFERCLIQ